MLDLSEIFNANLIPRKLMEVQFCGSVNISLELMRSKFRLSPKQDSLTFCHAALSPWP